MHARAQMPTHDNMPVDAYAASELIKPLFILAPDKDTCVALVQQLMNYELEHHLLITFIHNFMLKSKSSTLKWSVHSMMQHVFQGCNFNQQVTTLCAYMYALFLGVLGISAGCDVEFMAFGPSLRQQGISVC